MYTSCVIIQLGVKDMKQLILMMVFLSSTLAFAKVDERLISREKIQEKISQINNSAAYILSQSQYAGTTDKELCFKAGEMIANAGEISPFFGPAKLTKIELSQIVKILTVMEDMKRVCLGWPREESQGDIGDASIGMDAFNLVDFTQQLKL
jgi:hypothetical protein